MTRDHRRLAAIVSADVVGYSLLMGRDDSATLAGLKAHRQELIDPKIAEYGGRIVKTTGDGLLLEFPSVVDAVRCAVDVQRGMAERNAGVPAEQRIEFRIGINVGDIIIDGDDIFGDGVNVAARLQTLAEPGGICVSRVVRDQVLDKLSFAFDDLGSQQVKNIARPVEAYRVDLGTEALPTPSRSRKRWLRHTRGPWRWVAAGVLALGVAGIAMWTLPPFWKTPAAPAPPPLSIALLPFETPAGNEVQKQYAESLRRDLNTGLAAVERFVKTVQSDVRANGGENPREFDRRINVRYVVEGEVRRGAAGNVVNFRMVDVHTGAQFWGEQYDFPDAATPVEFSIKVRQIVRQVATTVMDAETRRVLAQPIDRLNAVELVLRGYAVSHESSTLASIRSARQLYDAALRLDPNLVPALGLRSEILDAENDVDPNLDHDRMVREMEEFSSRALKLDATDRWVWRERSLALADGGRWNAAVEAVDQAIKLDPYNADNLAFKGWLMNMTGRPADALSLADRAIALAPSNIWWEMRIACEANLLLGQTDNAIATCEKAAGLGTDWIVQLFLVAAYANHGDLAKAIAAKDRVLQTAPGYTISQLRAKRYSEVPEYLKLAEKYWYAGLGKAGIPEK